jgi:hypothetical protein
MLSLIGDLIGVISKALGIAKPLVRENQAQEYEEQFIDRISEWQRISRLSDKDERADLMYNFVKQLCVDSGRPPTPRLSRDNEEAVSGSSEPSLSVPFSLLHCLVIGQAELIKMNKLMASAIEVIKEHDN